MPARRRPVTEVPVQQSRPRAGTKTREWYDAFYELAYNFADSDPGQKRSHDIRTQATQAVDDALFDKMYYPEKRIKREQSLPNAEIQSI